MDLAARNNSRVAEVALGMVLLGVIFSSIMYGIMLTQVYKYYQRFKQDALTVKFVVFSVLLLNTASMFFVGHAAWYYLVEAVEGSRILHSIWSLSVELILSIIMSGLSETFLAFKVYKLSGEKHWLLAILISLVLLHFGSGLVAGIKILLLGQNAMLSSATVPSILRLASAAVCDTCIALSMAYFLHRKRTGFKKSDEIIDSLITLSINSGVLTSVASIASLITYKAAFKTWVYTALCFLLSRLYATTFLCAINSRQILMQANHDEENESRPRAGPNIKRRGTQWPILHRSGGDKHFNPPTQVYVVTETVRDMSPQPLETAKIRNASVHVKEILENSSSSSLGETSSLQDSLESSI